MIIDSLIFPLCMSFFFTTTLLSLFSQISMAHFGHSCLLPGTHEQHFPLCASAKAVAAQQTLISGLPPLDGRYQLLHLRNSPSSVFGSPCLAPAASEPAEGPESASPAASQQKKIPISTLQAINKHREQDNQAKNFCRG